MTEKEIKLVEDNVKLATYITNKWVKKTGLEWEDAISAAEYGLIKAAMKYESDKGFCFSTYAVHIMENEIRMELRKMNRRKRIVYFDDPIKEIDDKLMLGDTIADTRDHFAMVEVLDDLERRSKQLTEKERVVLGIRFQYPEKTQAECGRMVGLQQSAFSRCLTRAKKKLMEE